MDDRAARSARSGYTVPYITRKVPYYEVLDEEGLAIIERNALHPKVTIENTIPYVMDNLDPMEVNGALHDAYGKLMKYLSYRKFSDD